ncbi:unnamed protein product, partial [Prorocentrum cordatum]
MAQFVSSDEDAALARRICLRLLAAEGHVPAAVWGALVCAHARDGDADAAFALLSRLEARGGGGAEVPPLVFEELIEGLVRDRRLQAAFDTFQRMRTWSLMEPSARLYAIMIRACGLSKDPERAAVLFEELCAREEPTPEEGGEPSRRGAVACALCVPSSPLSSWSSSSLSSPSASAPRLLLVLLPLLFFLLLVAL